MSGLNRRQRRILEALGQDLAREDPSLAAQLSQASPTARTWRLPRWAYRLGAAMFLTGVLLLVWGLVFADSAASVIGAVLLLLCWMPAHFAAGNAGNHPQPPHAPQS